MIASLVAAFAAGVFATLGALVYLERRDEERNPPPKARRPWKTITNAEGSSEIEFTALPGALGDVCRVVLHAAADDPALTRGGTAQKVEGQRYRVFVSWRMVFTVDPQKGAPKR